MPDIFVTGIINWFHVVSVIGWTGAVITFIVSLQPSLAKFSPQANGEFVVKALPRLVRSIQVFSVLTLTFGPLLAFTMNDGEPNVFDFVSPWSVFVTIGAALGITMLLMVFLFLTYFLLSYLPIPTGSGVSELGFGSILIFFGIPDPIRTVILVVWSFLCVQIYTLLGGAFFLGALRRRKKAGLPPEPEIKEP